MEYYSAVKRSKLSSHERTQRSLQCMLLRERSRSEKATCCVIPTVWYSGKETLVFVFLSTLLWKLELPRSPTLSFLSSGRPAGTAWVCPLHTVPWNLPRGRQPRESHFSLCSQGSLVSVGLCPVSFTLSFYIVCPFFGFRWRVNQVLVTPF